MRNFLPKADIAFTSYNDQNVTELYRFIALLASKILVTVPSVRRGTNFNQLYGCWKPEFELYLYIGKKIGRNAFIVLQVCNHWTMKQEQLRGRGT